MSFLQKTKSLCPQCLRVIDAHYVKEEIQNKDWVLLKKNCPEHGHFSVPIWVNLKNTPSFEQWYKKSKPHYVKFPLTKEDKGCPYDCGLCPNHAQHTCCVLLEVTKHCNMQCPICYAQSVSAENNLENPDLASLQISLEKLMQHAGGHVNIQISGGEPTIRNDLSNIIQLIKNTGFSFVQLNTNGLRLGNDNNYAQTLKDAGLSLVYLQWDDLCDESYLKVRGRACYTIKQKALQNCIDANLPVVLVCTVIKGINDSSLGAMIYNALAYGSLVRGFHLQPVSTFGRYPWDGKIAPRITIPEILYELEKQTHGMLKAKHFSPPQSEHALCSFNAVYKRHENKLVPTGESNSCCAHTNPAQKAQEFVASHWGALPSITDINDTFDATLNQIQQRFTISGMAFQDAYSIDLERLRKCHIHIISEDHKLMPFCAYNLTSADGYPLYRSI